MGRKGITGLKVRVGWECCISRKGPDGPSSTLEVYKLEESKEEVVVLVGVGTSEEARTQHREQLQEEELPRVLEKERSEYFKWTHLEQVQQGGARVRINVAACQEKKNEPGKKRKQVNNFEEAVCCPSALFRGQHDKK